MMIMREAVGVATTMQPQIIKHNMTGAGTLTFILIGMRGQRMEWLGMRAESSRDNFRRARRNEDATITGKCDSNDGGVGCGTKTQQSRGMTEE
jgi:hypothetical protein